MSSAAIDTVHEIDTPEHLAFRARIAGPGRRFIAFLLDLIIQFVIMFVLSLLMASFGMAGMEGLGMGLFMFAMWLLSWFYFTISETITGGRSLGKMALKLRVVRPNGLPITWRHSILRNFLRAADHGMMPTPLLFGPLVMTFDKRFRRLGDMAADTIVVVEEASGVRGEMAVEADPELVDELPGSLPLDRDDLEAIELFVNRQHVSDARREELASIVAKHYAKRLSIPTPRDPTKFLASVWVRAQDPKRRMGR